MKVLIFLFFIAFCSIVSANTYYVAPITATPAGNDANAGTIASPWATWQKAFNTANVGDTVYFRDGVYYVTSKVSINPPYSGHDGTNADPICYFNYPNEVPILDGINKTSPSGGIDFQNVDNIHIKGLTVRNNLQLVENFGDASGISFAFCDNITIENCISYNNGRRGFYLYKVGSVNVLNCDAYNNCDALMQGYAGGGGDGFIVWDDSSPETTSSHVVLNGCRAWHNSDDGFDLEIEGLIEADRCWSFNNGYLDGDGTGFKLGLRFLAPGVLKRIITNCVSAYNKFTGFSTNDRNCGAKGMHIYNNTSYHNGYHGYADPVWGFYIYNTISADEAELMRSFKNNISYANEGGSACAGINALYTHEYNSWDISGVTITDADFISVDSTRFSGPRRADGSLPDLNFLKLSPTSHLIDAGTTNTVLPFIGKAPDLGAYEYDPQPGSNKYPSVVITSPSVGSIFTAPADITIIANAADADGSIGKVEFFNGAVKVGEKTSSPWSYTWNNVPEGTYSLTAVATDNLNAKTPSSAISITVNNPTPNQPPVITITNPVTGSTFTALANIAFTANASDADGLVTKVEFFNGASKLSEKTSGPWSFTWNNVPAGTYTLTAVATDNSGAKTNSFAVPITVNNSPPVITISNPVVGSTFTAPANVTITANASDADGTVSKVEFFNGATKLGEKTSGPWSFAWNNVTAGTYSLTAAATDNSGAKTTSSAVPITVNNSPPIISISDPVTGSSFTAPANITITANASDADGTVSKVEFFNGAVKLGEKTSSPWSFGWNNIPTGTYSITAAATDNSNAKTTSSAVTITVNNLPPVTNQPPVITLTDPIAGSTFSASANITITANASDPDGTVSKVEFFNGATKLGEKTSGPWSFAWNNVTAGAYSLTAIATDNSGAKTTSSVVPITLNNLPPVITISNPADGSAFTVPVNITIIADASDADGTVTKVEFFNGATKLGEKASVPWSFTWNNLSAGIYSLTAVASDNINAKTTSSIVSLTVNDLPPVTNQPPVVSIANPSKGQKYQRYNNITMEAVASDPDGTISKVEFYNGNNKLAEIITAPYSFTWQYVDEGTYSITARAIDNLNSATISSPVWVEVEAGSVNDVNPEIFNLYPNPNDGHFSIDLIEPAQSGNREITVVTIDGKEIYNEILPQEEITNTKLFDLSWIKPGFYILIVSGKYIIATKKFIKY